MIIGQVTIYLDNDTENKLKKAAKSSHLSVSKWVATNRVKVHPGITAVFGFLWPRVLPSIAVEAPLVVWKLPMVRLRS